MSRDVMLKHSDAYSWKTADRGWLEPVLANIRSVLATSPLGRGDGLMKHEAAVCIGRAARSSEHCPARPPEARDASHTCARHPVARRYEEPDAVPGMGRQR